MDRAVIIDTPTGIEFYRLCVLRSRLNIEIDTGLKFRVSTLKAVNRTLGTKYHSKRKALAHLNRYIAEFSKPLLEDPL